jgi:GMP synthase (glutamine-hydrolysing)
MPKLLVCQHVPYEPLGTLDPKLRGSGFRIRYVNFGRDPHLRPTLEGYDGLVILGGPMNVDQLDRHPHLATEMELVLEAIDRQIPVLGICLGAQLIAKALGAAVRAGTKKEIGWHDVVLTDEGRSDPLLGHLGGETRLFQWHGDVFDLPGGAVHYGTNVYGFQFHLEADEPLIERWLRVPAHRDDIERLAAEVHPDEIRRETRERIGDLQARADLIFADLVRLFGAERPRRRVLPSR